jgi:hypothetical protein
MKIESNDEGVSVEMTARKNPIVISKEITDEHQK